MNTKKNIDRLFQEKLKNLEKTPSKKVWKEIESKITKKKRTVFPFWWFSSGVAAVLIIALFLYPFNDNNTNLLKENSNKEIITKTPTKDVLPLIKDSTETTIVKTTKNQLKKIDTKLNIKKQKKDVLLVQQKTVKNEETIKNTAIASKKSTVFKKDTIINNKAKQTPALEETLIAELQKKATKIDIQKTVESAKKEENTINSSKKSWSIAPVFAVLNSNSLTDTSPIHNSLSGSTKGKNTISYGVKIAYQINTKWTVQSGLHLQEMRYNNNNLAIISSSTTATNISFRTAENFAFENNSSDSFNTSSAPLTALSLDGSLSQNYSYFEIPLEIKYNIIHSTKIKTHLVAGFSTLFLNDNKIQLYTTNINQVGKANNLNNINFSGNLGIDLNYNLTPKWSMHMNPMFKAQLNTFNANSNGFKPYTIGFYTGFFYQF